MNKKIITNNSKVYESFKNSYEVIFSEKFSYVDVLCATRDLVHDRHKLLTHPMAGSLKPNQTPYKSIIVCDTQGTDNESVLLIENSLEAAFKFLKFKKTPAWSDRILNDFKTVDLSLVENVINNPMFKII